MSCDSQSSNIIAKNLVHDDRTKTIEIDRHFIDKKFEDKVISAMLKHSMNEQTF